MDDRIKKIIQFLSEEETNFGKAKEKLSEEIEKVGMIKQSIKLQKNVWEDIGKAENQDDVFTDTAIRLHEDLVERSRNYSRGIDQFVVMMGQDSTSSIVGTASTLAVSGAVFSFDKNNMPASHTQLVNFIDQQSQRTEIYNKLLAIDRSLAQEYNNAWNSLHVLIQDETRSPMFLIREVINRLYEHYASDEEVKSYCEKNGIKDYLVDPKSKNIKRSVRIKCIAAKIFNEDKKDAFLKQEEAFNNINNHLSGSAKKHGELNEDNTKALLYQADFLIKLLVDSFDN